MADEYDFINIFGEEGVDFVLDNRYHIVLNRDIARFADVRQTRRRRANDAELMSSLFKNQVPGDATALRQVLKRGLPGF